MTDTTLAPTDAEIEELLKSCGMRWAERSYWLLEDADLHPAIRTAIAKWGAPAPASDAALRTAAQAIVDRWDAPSWKDIGHTGLFIDRLRDALAAHPAQEARVPIDPKVVGDLWLKSQGVCLTFCRLLEAEHGITAAQKETP